VNDARRVLLIEMFVNAPSSRLRSATPNAFTGKRRSRLDAIAAIAASASRVPQFAGELLIQIAALVSAFFPNGFAIRLFIVASIGLWFLVNSFSTLMVFRCRWLLFRLMSFRIGTDMYGRAAVF
jgi:hypothetical protein